MAKTTEDVVKNLKGKGVYQGPAKDSNPPMDTDFKTPQWLKDTGEAVVEGVSDAGKFVGNKLAEAFPAKSWTPQNTQQLVLGALPMLTGLAFGGTRGAAIGGQVGLKAIADIERGGSEASIEKQKRFWEQDFKERDLEMRAKKLDRDYMALMAQLGIRQEKFGLEKELAPSQRQLIEAKTAQALAGAEASKAKARESGKGKKLPSNAVNLLSEGKAIPNMLNDTASIIDVNKDLFSPVFGKIMALNPYDERVQTLQADLKAKAQAVGRYLEGGVLRREDEIKYQKMMPQLGDTAAVAANKLAIVRKLVADKQNQYIESYTGQGYDMSGVGVVSAGAIPKVLTGKGTAKPPSPRVKQLMDRDGISQQRAEAVLKAFDAQKKGGK